MVKIICLPSFSFKYNFYKYKDKINSAYLLRIDLNKLPKNISFFEDPNFKMGEAIWTYNNIPPNSIEIIQKLDLKY